MDATTSIVITMSLLVAVCAAGAIVIVIAGLRNRRRRREAEAMISHFEGPVLTWQDAETLAAAHMRRYGFEDARSTASGADGGLDVVATFGVAQVKFLSAPVGRPVVQALRGAAHGYEHAFFYALSGYTASAVQFADEAAVALWQFDQFGTVWPINGWAEGVAAPEEMQA